MSQHDTYLHRLDRLCHGYVRNSSTNRNRYPIDMIELIKICHSNNESPKLVFNVLLSSTDGNCSFECFLDKMCWNILNINTYTFHYEVEGKYIYSNDSTDKQGSCEVKLYDSINYLGFGKFPCMHAGRFDLYAKDANDNIVLKSENIRKEITYSALDTGMDADYWNKFDVENKGKLSLNDWIEAKNRLNNKSAEFIWKRVFYFVNFM
eukprot:214112_1